MLDVKRNLFGCWRLTAVRFKNYEGIWEHEEVYGGFSAFTEAGFMTTFSRTSDLPFGYSGTFSLNGNEIEITPEVCSIPELEGTKFFRTVKKLTSEDLTLGTDDEATGRHYELDFKLLTSTFGR